MPTIYGYGRVSTDHQVTLEHQERLVKHWAESRIMQDSSFRWGGFYGDVVSACNPCLRLMNRDMMSQLVTLLGQGDIVVVAAFDRLVRSQRDLADFMELMQERGSRLVACDLGIDTTTPAGRAMLEVICTMKGFEASEIRRRVFEGIQHRKFRLSGQVLDKAPPGWKRIRKNTYVTDPQGREMGRRMLHVFKTTKSYLDSPTDFYNLLIEDDEFNRLHGEFESNARSELRDTHKLDPKTMVRHVVYCALDWPLMNRPVLRKHYFTPVVKQLGWMKEPEKSVRYVRALLKMLGSEIIIDRSWNKRVLEQLALLRRDRSSKTKPFMLT